MTDLDVRTTLDQALGDLYEWDPRELAMLAIAEAIQDTIRDLEDLLTAQGLMVSGSKGQPRLNPVVAELRLQRAALARTIEGIRLPDESANKSVRHQRAAQRRWGTE